MLLYQYVWQKQEALECLSQYEMPFVHTRAPHFAQNADAQTAFVRVEPGQHVQ